MDPPGVDELLPLLRGRFGIESLQPLQRLAIANVLAAAGRRRGEATPASGADDPAEDREGPTEEEGPPGRQLVILPTGGGKSLCFQGPALLLDAPTLVVYPLLALLEDQARRLRAAGMEVAVLRGGQDREERRDLLERLGRGEVRIALATPELLLTEGMRRAMKGMEIAHLAIDEAHCVVEWGESFRPAYRELGGLVETLRPRMVSAFTATAGPELRRAVARRLFGEEAYVLIEGNPDRPNISWSVLPTLSRSASLFRLLRELERPLIVFSSSRRGVERLAAAIRTRRPDLEVRFYHAGLEAEEKRAVEAWFLASAEAVLVATCAYGMGVDKGNIRSVIHWRLPSSVEAYLQEAGRGGRDGLPASAVLLLGEDEEFVGGGAAEEGAPRSEARSRGALLAWARAEEGCRRATLLSLLGAKPAAGCGGCDRCSGRAASAPAGREAILGLIAREPRRWTRREFLALLTEAAKGRKTSLLDDLPLPLLPGLQGWRGEELAEALGTLLRGGALHERPSRPWKGRLELRPPCCGPSPPDPGPPHPPTGRVARGPALGSRRGGS